MGHQLLDRLAPVVARHVGVQVEPDTLDPVVVRAVRREEVEHHAVAELGEEALRLLAGVDDVVVDDEVDEPRVAVLGGELPDQFAEEVAGLALRLDEGDTAGRRVKRTGDEPFFCSDQALRPDGGGRAASSRDRSSG